MIRRIVPLALGCAVSAMLCAPAQAITLQDPERRLAVDGVVTMGDSESPASASTDTAGRATDLMRRNPRARNLSAILMLMAASNRGNGLPSPY